MKTKGYTISQMSEISKISKKALRFYDEADSTCKCNTLKVE